MKTRPSLLLLRLRCGAALLALACGGALTAPGQVSERAAERESVKSDFAAGTRPPRPENRAPSAPSSFDSDSRRKKQEAREHADDETTTSSIKFSDPAKPGTVKLVLPWADVHVTGTDGDAVVVSSSLNDKSKSETREDGLRRLDDEMSFELSEAHNVVTVAIVGENAWAAHGSEFTIKVPRRTNLVVRTEAGGDIEVEKVEGDLDINSMNGEVTLRDIASSAVVNTMNGEIRATFKTAPVKPVSFSTMNGEISLFLPKDTKANLRLRTQNGSILTDFGADLLKTKNENRVKAAGDDDRIDVITERLMKDHPNMSREHAHETAVVAASSVDADQAGRETDKAARASDRAARAADDAVRTARTVARETSRAAIAAAAPAAPTPPATPDAAEAPEAPAAPGERNDSEFQREARREIQNAMRAVRDVTRNVGRSIGQSFRPGGPNAGFSVGGKSITGTLNGGGVEISLASMNGTVTVRQSK
ncbi:MAG: DUF4097 family beta strand repeat protein [Opitutae bacterium]|nr:DUF4097 family beta strand repeat protein [Opitutae bacterium]